MEDIKMNIKESESCGS